MKRNAIDLGTLDVCTLFRKYFIPTLFGMLSISAVTAVDGILVGHGIGSDGIAAINICIPLLMLFTGIGLMAGVGSSVVASIQLSKGKLEAARLNVTQALLFVTIAAIVPSALMMAYPSATARFLGASEHLTPMVREYLDQSPGKRSTKKVRLANLTNKNEEKIQRGRNPENPRRGKTGKQNDTEHLPGTQHHGANLLPVAQQIRRNGAEGSLENETA